MPSHYRVEERGGVMVGLDHSGEITPGVCRRCGDVMPVTGEHFRWQPSVDRFHSWCRSCERAHRGARTGAARRETRALSRRFGVELEFYCSSRRETIQEAFRSAPGMDGWRVRSDGSLSGRNGHELVSPVLQGDEGFEAVRRACAILSALGATVNVRCGFHCHLDMSGLGARVVKQFVRSYVHNQHLMDGLVSESRRGGRNTYCQPWGEYDLRSLDEAASLTRVGVARYKTINVKSYGRHGTIEIRQHQGTLSFRKVEAWVKMAMALLAASSRDVVARQPSVSDLFTAITLEEDVAAYLIGRAVQFAVAPVTGDNHVATAVA